jgi:hypothetical protein
MSEFISTLRKHFEENMSEEDLDLKGWIDNCDMTISRAISAIKSAVDDSTFPEVNFASDIMKALEPYTARTVELMLVSISDNVDEDRMDEILVLLRQCAGYGPYEQLVDDVCIVDEDIDTLDFEGLKEEYGDLVQASKPKPADEIPGLEDPSVQEPEKGPRKIKRLSSPN